MLLRWYVLKGSKTIKLEGRMLWVWCMAWLLRSDKRAKGVYRGGKAKGVKQGNSS